MKIYRKVIVIDINIYFPEFNFSKLIDINPNYNGNFTFKSSGHQKNYDTNIYEAQINNDFNFNSHDFISELGLVTDYRFLLKILILMEKIHRYMMKKMIMKYLVQL